MKTVSPRLESLSKLKKTDDLFLTIELFTTLGYSEHLGVYAVEQKLEKCDVKVLASDTSGPLITFRKLAELYVAMVGI